MQDWSVKEYEKGRLVKEYDLVDCIVYNEDGSIKVQRKVTPLEYGLALQRYDSLAPELAEQNMFNYAAAGLQAAQPLIDALNEFLQQEHTQEEYVAFLPWLFKLIQVMLDGEVKVIRYLMSDWHSGVTPPPPPPVDDAPEIQTQPVVNNNVHRSDK